MPIMFIIIFDIGTIAVPYLYKLILDVIIVLDIY